MNDITLTCAMCGHTFEPQANTSCQACPLNRGCTLVCCPACGFENVNPQQSKLARAAATIFARLGRKPGVTHLPKESV